ncbi:MAG: hypothetical protein MJ033_08045 [Victivallaceae bacterium]|nr:hypothetical protein [Victivallaceae bacterium]
MLKKTLMMLAFLCIFAVSLSAGKSAMPKWKGDRGTKVLLYNGGRPWQGDGIAKILVDQKCRVRSVNSKYLDGFGGASIKDHAHDKVEPTPLDGITPTMKNLAPYKLVIFHLIRQELLDKMLTSERIAALRAYVENGGNLLFFLNAPSEAGDLLPVELGSSDNVTEALTANCPEGELFKSFPKTLPVLAYYREAVATPGAEVLSYITTPEGQKVMPFIARKTIGKGTVTFVNAESRYALSLKEFSQWAYGNAFFVALVADSGKFKAVPEKLLKRYQEIPARTDIDDVTVSVRLPENKIEEDTSCPVIDGRTATFANGVKLVVKENDAVAVSFPGDETPFFRDFAIPQLGVAADRNYFDDATAEATDAAAEVEKIDLKWQFEKLLSDGGKAVVVYTAPGAEMRWNFKAGKMLLDGREMQGFAESVEVLKADKRYLTTVTFEAEIDPVSPKFARRFSCYSPPRGYTDFDMSGAKEGDTSDWSIFGSGQPFELLVCDNGVYMANIDDIQALSVRMIRKKGGKFITSKRGTPFGRVHAPVKTAYYWHWKGSGAERGHNDYLAMYQFMRKMLRAKAGLQELPAYPMGHYNHISKSEQEMVIEGIRQAGYRYILIPGFETFISSTFSPETFDRNRELLAKGLQVRVWSAGSYEQGNGGWILNNHPEWFVKDKTGKVFSYGGRYPVIDVNNPEFYQWYTSYVKPAIESGIRGVYRDMDGAAGNCVNYELKESPHGLPSQLKFYRFFQENGCRVSVEGMNPVVLDEYWYRPERYTSLQGCEFALVGGAPMNYDPYGLTLDPFRLGMYAAFMTFEHSGTILGFDRVPGEIDRGKRALSFVPKFNEALDHVGMPFVRETPFGTMWVSDKGGALFFWNPTKKATVELPQGWKIRGVEGNVLTDVKGDAIYLIDKE